MLRLTIETDNTRDFDAIEIAYNLGINECSIDSFWERTKKNLPVKFKTGKGGNHFWISYKSNNKRAAIIYF